MKIIRLTTFLDFGGIEKRLINISSHQDKNDWLFCAIHHGGNAELAIQNNGKRVICFNYSYKIPSFITLYKLIQFFKKEQPQVVHTSGAEANFHGILAARIAGVPLIIGEEVGIPKQSKFAKIIFLLIYKIADYVVGNSNEVLSYLKIHNKITDSKLIKIPNPVVFPHLPNVKKTEDDLFRIISVSRLEKVKNIDSVLRVIAKLRKQNWDVQYTILGDGKELNHLKNLTKVLNIEQYVIFLGFQNNPYSYLLTSDLYLLASFTEGFSNSLAEAMYCELPCLTSKVGAAEELIKNNENGWIVNVNDDEDLFQTIEGILKMEKTKRIAIGKKAKTTIIENYSLQNHIDLLMAVYKSKENETSRT